MFFSVEMILFLKFIFNTFCSFYLIFLLQETADQPAPEGVARRRPWAAPWRPLAAFPPSLWRQGRRPSSSSSSYSSHLLLHPPHPSLPPPTSHHPPPLGGWLGGGGLILIQWNLNRPLVVLFFLNFYWRIGSCPFLFFGLIRRCVDLFLSFGEKKKMKRCASSGANFRDDFVNENVCPRRTFLRPVFCFFFKKR